jgi:hypothetical protein
MAYPPGSMDFIAFLQEFYTNGTGLIHLNTTIAKTSIH